MKVLDKDVVNQRIIEVCEHYLGPGSGGGERRVWACPGCGKKDFHVHGGRGVGGCFGAGCEVPGATDAVGLIGYFEGLADHGREFLARLVKGYEILGLQASVQRTSSAHQPEAQAKTTDDKETSSSANDNDATGGDATGGDDDDHRIRWVPGAGPKDDVRPGGQSSANGNRRSEGAPTGAAEDRAEKPAADKDKAPRRVRERPLRTYIERPDGLREAVEAVIVEEVDEESYLKETADAVYRRILELCPVQKRDLAFWDSRGVWPETVERGKFGSLCRERHRNLPAALGRTFGEEELLCVGGFYRTDRGEIGFNLRGDYALIPYHDAAGYITTIEGRVLGEPREGEAKYKALLNSGSHLYVFPEYHPQEIVAFCEGAIGAIVAAQSGIAVGSIKGFRNYRSWNEGNHEPLPELGDVDFGGRRVLYIPDTDVKPKVRAEVQAEAPAACEWLISRQNGLPKLAQLPAENKDLDEWLLSVTTDERAEAFAQLAREAVSPEQWRQGSQERTNPEAEEKAPPETLLEALNARAEANLRAGEADTAEEAPVERERTAEAADPTQSLTAATEGRTEADEKETAEQQPTANEVEDEEATSATTGTPTETAQPQEEAGKCEQLPLADESHFGGEEGYRQRDLRKNRTQQTEQEVSQKTGEKPAEGQDAATQGARPAVEDTNKTRASQPELPQGKKQQDVQDTENSSEPSDQEKQSAAKRDQKQEAAKQKPKQQEVRHKRPMRPGQQKWYDSLDKPTIYRPPEEREKKPKPEPQQRSTDHLRPEYLNYAEVILALFILAVVSAVVWVSAEYLLAEAVLSSPLGWLEATGWISRMSVYVLVGFGAGFGVSLWRYKRRRQALIDHLTGRTKR